MREVFGWVIAEAMAYGRPVVATRVGGIPEVVSEHESGYLIERGDVAALAENLRALIDDPGRRIAMGKAGREKVQTLFDLQKNVKQLLQSYGLVHAPALASRRTTSLTCSPVAFWRRSAATCGFRNVCRQSSLEMSPPGLTF